MIDDVSSAIDRLESGDVALEDLTFLLGVTDSKESELIEKRAAAICSRHYGNKVYLRGLIEISNYCRKNCNYCGLRKDNRNIDRYRIDGDELFQTMKDAYNYGFKTLVMQGGEDPGFDSVIIETLKRARVELGDDFAVTLSLGERSFEQYKALKDAGANRFLMRIETTDPTIFNWLHPDDSLEKRIECLKELKKLDFEVGSGILFGLRNQSFESIAKDLLFLKELGCHMVGVGPFCPHGDTPMKDQPAGTIEMSTRLVSLIRILLPKSNIPATTAMGTIHPEGRTLALKAGANVLMPNCTPFKYRKDYELYNDKVGISFDDEDSPVASTKIAEAAGKEASYLRGDSLGKELG